MQEKSIENCWLSFYRYHFNCCALFCFCVKSFMAYHNSSFIELLYFSCLIFLALQYYSVYYFQHYFLSSVEVKKLKKKLGEKVMNSLNVLPSLWANNIKRKKKTKRGQFYFIKEKKILLKKSIPPLSLLLYLQAFSLKLSFQIFYFSSVYYTKNK